MVQLLLTAQVGLPGMGRWGTNTETDPPPLSTVPAGVLGGSGAVLAPNAAQHGVDPVHIEGDTSKEIRVLASGTSPDHKGVHALEYPIAD